MGVVYEAEDALLKRKVAIKLLPKEVSTNPEALKRFLREAQAAAKLSHPNVVAVFDIGEADGSYYIVMELITGGTAQEVLRSRGTFHWTEATSIVMDVCRGMAAAHKAGLIHRDIKPANILRSADGIVKLADFGLVKPAGRKGTVVTGLGEVVGTPHYMSPEQGQSAAVDERSDIYALGATYYALLTGQPPYQAADSIQVLFAHCSQPIPDPRAIVADIPDKCVAILRKAMAKNRAERYANAGEFMKDLEEAAALSSTANPSTAAAKPAPAFVWSRVGATETINPLSLADAYPGERTERLAEPKRRPWLLIGIGLLGLGAIGLLAAAILAGAYFMGGNRQPPAPPPIVPEAKAADWPTLSATADKAIRSRNLTAMKAAIDNIKLMQQRVQEENPGQREAMNQMLMKLEKARAFRERITEKGLVIALDGIVTSVRYSPDDRRLAVGQGSGGAGAFVFDSYTGEKLHTLWPPGKKGMTKVQALAFSHDSEVLGAACADTLGIQLWHFRQAKGSSLPVVPGVIRALDVTFSPTTRNIVASFEPFGEGRGRPYLKAWNIDTGKEAFPFKAEHVAKVPAVAYCAGGQQVATGSLDRRVVLWNAETGRIWRELHTGLAVQAIACGPHGKTLAVAGSNDDGHVLQFWDYPASKLLATKPSPHGPARCVAFNQDGTLLASGSGSDILLWNPETQQLLATLTGHGNSVASLAFSAEGGILATGSNDQTMRLWDVTRFLPPRLEP